MKMIYSGKSGGKATGCKSAKTILGAHVRSDPEGRLAASVRFPKSWVVGTDCFDSFLAFNKLEKHVESYLEKGPTEENYHDLNLMIMGGKFPDEIRSSFSTFLKDVNVPIVLRSSSLLEDSIQTPFAGKYETVFMANRGTPGDRLAIFCEKLKHVYSSTFSPNPIAYRRNRDLLKNEEKMAVLVQEIIGKEYEGNFMPLMAGVGFSKNTFIWSPAIKPEDGLIRLVFGLGTRAVGRDFARLFSPGKPSARPEGHVPGTIRKYSQMVVDTIDLSNDTIRTLPLRNLVRSGLDCFEGAHRLISIFDGYMLKLPSTKLWTSADSEPVLTFDFVLTQQWYNIHLPKLLRKLMVVLEKGLGYPVDIEFAMNIEDENLILYILQVRPLKHHGHLEKIEIPDVQEEKIIVKAPLQNGNGETGKVSHLVYIDPEKYLRLSKPDRSQIAKIIGCLNQTIDKKSYMLLGPGRWGSTNSDLGVPVQYAQIDRCALLGEISLERSGCLPELSFGTHFFQDLMVDDIFYMPVYPELDNHFLNKPLIDSLPNIADKFCLEIQSPAKILDCVKVIGLAEKKGSYFRAALSSTESTGIIYIDG